MRFRKAQAASAAGANSPLLPIASSVLACSTMGFAPKLATARCHSVGGPAEAVCVLPQDRVVDLGEESGIRLHEQIDDFGQKFGVFLKKSAIE
jgi:hypothetical protein